MSEATVYDGRKTATRDALVAAAREAFGRRGYAATSVQRIVEDAGVTKGAFYHHFRDKQEIFLRVFEAIEHDLGRAAFILHAEYEAFPGPGAAQGAATRLDPAAMTAQSNAEAWRDLRARCVRYVELHADPRVERVVLRDARAVLPQEERSRVEHEYGLPLLRADLRRVTNRGLLRPMPLRVLAAMLLGALQEACILVAHADDRAAALRDADAVIEAWFEGMRAGAAGAEDDVS